MRSSGHPPEDKSELQTSRLQKDVSLARAPSGVLSEPFLSLALRRIIWVILKKLGVLCL